MKTFKKGEKVLLYRKTCSSWPEGCDLDKDSFIADKVILKVHSYSYAGNVRVYTDERHSGTYRTVPPDCLKSLTVKPTIIL